MHRHVVCCSSSAATKLFINYAGGAKFQAGLVASPNMSMQFSLGSVDVFLGGAAAFSVAVPGAATLASLYDTYQIEKVEYRIYLGANSSPTGQEDTGIAGTINFDWDSPLPIIGYAPDTDDANNTDLTDLQQFSNYKQAQPIAGRPMYGSLVPAVAGGVWNGPIRSGYTRLVRQDVNCANPGVPHYGLKACIDGLQAGANSNVCLASLYFKLHFVMKQTR